MDAKLQFSLGEKINWFGFDWADGLLKIRCFAAFASTTMRSHIANRRSIHMHPSCTGAGEPPARAPRK
jgi:hypothetical protein